MTRSLEEQKRLKSQIAEKEDKLQELFASLSRLRKLQRAEEERGAELFSRGMMELDKEDGIISDEALLEEQQVIGDLHGLGAVDVLDWSMIFDSVAGSGDSAGVVAGNSEGS